MIPACPMSSAAQTDQRQATSFGAAAATYERGRPPYPAEAVDWLLPLGATRVLDLGAGTGKLPASSMTAAWT